MNLCGRGGGGIFGGEDLDGVIVFEVLGEEDKAGFESEVGEGGEKGLSLLGFRFGEDLGGESETDWAGFRFAVESGAMWIFGTFKLGNLIAKFGFVKDHALV